MPSGGCCIVRADRNTVVAKRYVISTSRALPEPASKQKAAKEMSHIYTACCCEQSIFLAYTILDQQYSYSKSCQLCIIEKYCQPRLFTLPFSYVGVTIKGLICDVYVHSMYCRHNFTSNSGNYGLKSNNTE